MSMGLDAYRLEGGPLHGQLRRIDPAWLPVVRLPVHEGHDVRRDADPPMTEGAYVPGERPGTKPIMVAVYRQAQRGRHVLRYAYTEDVTL